MERSSPPPSPEHQDEALHLTDALYYNHSPLNSLDKAAVDAVHPLFRGYDSPPPEKDPYPLFICKPCKLQQQFARKIVALHFKNVTHEPKNSCDQCSGPIFEYLVDEQRDDELPRSETYHTCSTEKVKQIKNQLTRYANNNNELSL